MAIFDKSIKHFEFTSAFTGANKLMAFKELILYSISFLCIKSVYKNQQKQIVIISIIDSLMTLFLEVACQVDMRQDVQKKNNNTICAQFHFEIMCKC